MIMKYRHTMSLFFIALPICVLLRTIQLIFTIDMTTGFIKQHYYELSTVIMFVLCAAVAAVGFISLATDNIKIYKREPNPALAIVSLLTSGMFVYDTVTAPPAVSAGIWYHILLVLLGLASAIVFAAYGLQNIYPYNLPDTMFLIPVFYYVIKLINIFISTSSLALVTENILLIFTNGILLLFMFEFSKFKNNIDENNRFGRLFATGIVSVMLCIIHVIPKVIIFIKNSVKPSPHDISAMLLITSVAAFIFVFTVSNFQNSKKVKVFHVAKHLEQ